MSFGGLHAPPVGDLSLDAFQLLLDDVHGLVCLPLLKGLSYASNDAEAFLEGCCGLLANFFAAFVEERPSLGVAKDDPWDLDICKLVEAAINCISLLRSATATASRTRSLQ